jgi:hypothetical protein
MRDDDQFDDYEERGPYYRDESAYPVLVRTAGIVWIVFGGLILLNMALTVALLAVAAPAAGNQGGGLVAGGTCAVVLMGLFGGVFIHVGVQSITGTARDTLGNGIGSIIFGLLNFGGGAARLLAGDPISGGLNFFAGCGLLAAGVLALVGRADYRDWKRAHKNERPARPRYPEDDEDDDWE